MKAADILHMLYEVDADHGGTMCQLSLRELIRAAITTNPKAVNCLQCLAAMAQEAERMR